MLKPGVPANESERILELQQTCILETPEEERFDRYTRLAQQLFGVPIALVSLIDSDRQWFKSKQGLAAKETPRSISFCGHAILGDSLFVVEDATKDVRFADNPLVTDDPYVVFYAGVPLLGFRGSKLGTLCIIYHKPRSLSTDEASALNDLGALVSSEIAALQAAMTDELTHLSNRRGFDMLARQVIALCDRNNHQVWVLLLDLDGFKDINDQHGHETGDHALISFSNILTNTFRDSDVVARLGGDEFTVLLTNTGQKEVQVALLRLHDAVAEWNTNKHRYQLCYSVGTAAHDFSRSDIFETLQLADSNVYECKQEKTAATRRQIDS